MKKTTKSKAVKKAEEQVKKLMETNKLKFSLEKIENTFRTEIKGSGINLLALLANAMHQSEKVYELMKNAVVGYEEFTESEEGKEFKAKLEKTPKK